MNFRPHRFAIVLLALIVSLAAPRATAGDEGLPNGVEDGRHLYQIYCLSCHGESGRGDGPAAAGLRTRPADLARIELDEDGAYPRKDVYRSIEGIDVVPGHRSPEMPIWGFAFRQLDSDADPDVEVRTRIERLVLYLEWLEATRDDR